MDTTASRSCCGSQRQVAFVAMHVRRLASTRAKLPWAGRLDRVSSIKASKQGSQQAPEARMSSMTEPLLDKGSVLDSVSEASTSEVWASEAASPASTSSVAACALLVAGTAVGAGMLALPGVSAPAGFEASATALIAAAGYSVVTGLLVAEVTINSNQQQRQLQPASRALSATSLHNNDPSTSTGTAPSLSASSSASTSSVSLTSLAVSTLGRPWTPVIILPYLFLHYSCLVAYIAKAGELVSQWTTLPLMPSSVLFTALFGGGCYLLSNTLVDSVNGTLVFVLILTFVGLFGVAVTDVDPTNLLRSDWSELPPALPVIALAFVFQNIVPVVCQRLDYDRRKVQLSIFLGMGVSLLMFLLWDGAILGSATAAEGGINPLVALREKSFAAGTLADTFSFLAVATSFVCFVLSLTDFIADTFRSGQPSKDIEGQQTEWVAPRPILYMAALVPPTVLALLYPSIFFGALDYAGSYGVMTLFGVVPAIMAWKQRYSDGAVLAVGHIQMVPGGRATLAAVAAVAAGIIANQAQVHVHQLMHALSADA